MPSRYRLYRRCLVEVIHEKTRVDSSSVSASIDGDRYFAVGSEPMKRASAWHAVRLHHRCRLLRGAEAVCEQLGSLAHCHWQDQRDEAPGVAMARAHLLQGGIRCLGSARDEMVVHHTGRLLLECGLNPLRQNASAEVAQVKQQLRALEESGRKGRFPEDVIDPSTLREDVRQFRAKSLPSELPPELKSMVQSHWPL